MLTTGPAFIASTIKMKNHNTNTHGLNPEMNVTSRFPRLQLLNLRVNTPTAGLDTLVLFCCLGRMAFPAHLGLWWPYIASTRSLNSGDAIITAIESTGETAWNIDLGDTEFVPCNGSNVRIPRTWRVSKVDNYRLSVGYRRLRKFG